MHQPVIQQLIQLSEGALALAEQAVRERDEMGAKLAEDKGRVILHKVASASQVEETLRVMENGHLFPAANRDKVASLISTHEGALEMIGALALQSIAPEVGGEPVPPFSKTAAANSSSGDTSELALFADLARNGFK